MVAYFFGSVFYRDLGHSGDIFHFEFIETKKGEEVEEAKKKERVLLLFSR